MSTNTEQSRSAGGHLIVFPLGIVLACCLLGGWEFHLRSEGVYPSIRANNAYALKRSRAKVEPDSIVLIGSSLTASNHVQEKLEDAFKRPVSRFVRISSVPYQAYDYLAELESFHGTLVVTVRIDYLLAMTDKSWVKGWLRSLTKEAEKHWDDSLELSPAKLIHYALRRRVNNLFSFRAQEVTTSDLKLARSFYDGNFREKVYPMWNMDEDMQLLFHAKPKELYMTRWAAFTNIFITKLSWPKPHVAALSDKDWDELIAKWQHNQDRIKCRGGEVVYVVFNPAPGKHDPTFTNKKFTEFCDDLSAKCINVTETETLAPLFQPLDGFHLDVEQRGPFSEELIKVLQAKLAEKTSAPQCGGSK